MVAEVLPRRSELSDPAIANVDHIVLVFAAADPPFDPPNVTRFLVTAEQARADLPWLMAIQLLCIFRLANRPLMCGYRSPAAVTPG